MENPRNVKDSTSVHSWQFHRIPINTPVLQWYHVKCCCLFLYTGPFLFQPVGSDCLFLPVGQSSIGAVVLSSPLAGLFTPRSALFGHLLSQWFSFDRMAWTSRLASILKCSCLRPFKNLDCFGWLRLRPPHWNWQDLAPPSSLSRRTWRSGPRTRTPGPPGPPRPAGPRSSPAQRRCSGARMVTWQLPGDRMGFLIPNPQKKAFKKG